MTRHTASNIQEIPNVPAARHYTAQDNGLLQPWDGRVLFNSPFGPGVEQWFSKLYLEQAAGRTTETIVLWKSAKAHQIAGIILGLGAG